MKKLLTLLIGISFSLPLFSQTVAVEKARIAAFNFLSINEKEHHFTNLSFKTTLYDKDQTETVYIFDIDTTGFVIAGASQQFDPVVGYSFGGRWNSDKMSPSLISWLNSYIEDAYAVRHSDTLPATIEKQLKVWQKEWDALLNGNANYYSTKGAKNVNPLLETTWAQSDGYNNYCPLYSNARYSNNGRAVTGCVATAMAQIIRYHQYPNVGFGERSYHHQTYGILSVRFDTAYYDYSQMPTYVNAYSPAAQQHAVSQLCYHCGIAVKMDYENQNYTSGSGAHSNEVPTALTYFGYFGSYFYGKDAHNDIWDSLLRNDLDNSMPVFYSGKNSYGGHAFVCDGYRTYNSKYHFNFGWGGDGDGWYTLSSVNGYASNQDAVFNITPSHLGPYRNVYYFAPNATGDGTSWESPTSDFVNANNVLNIYSGGTIWLKSGVYYGDTTAETAFTLTNSQTIYGGFNGTESSIDERDLSSNTTVLSGMGSRRLIDASSNTRGCNIYDVTFADGYAPSGSVVNLEGSVLIERCSFVGNRCDSADGAALHASSSQVRTSKFYNNMCNAVIMDNVAIRNCLVAHNQGNGIIANDANVDGCDVVCNNGTGIVNNGTTKIRNCILWHNGNQLESDDISKIKFSAIEGFGERDSNSNFGISHENRPMEGIGPFFILPDTTMGLSEQLGDWHLSSLSPLVDAGDTLRTGSYQYDLDNSGRFRNGRTDIGCYEWVPGNAITEAQSQKLLIYPNPAIDHIVVDGANGLIELFDSMGRLLLHTSSQDTLSIDVSNLPKGLYIIRTANTAAKFLKK